MTDTSRWEDAYRRFETPAQEHRKFLRRLRRVGASGWSRESRVLEICSGRGTGIAAWRSLGFARVCGVDLSLALIERSAERGRCAAGDARVLPIRTASQDVVVVQGGLHHLLSVDDVRAALDEMRRVLAPAGRAVVIEPWATPFLRAVHLVAERPIARKLSNTLDAFAAMTDEERPTYEAWLARPREILAALEERFDAQSVRRRYGKLEFVGRAR